MNTYEYAFSSRKHKNPKRPNSPLPGRWSESCTGMLWQSDNWLPHRRAPGECISTIFFSKSLKGYHCLVGRKLGEDTVHMTRHISIRRAENQSKGLRCFSSVACPNPSHPEARRRNHHPQVCLVWSWKLCSYARRTAGRELETNRNVHMISGLGVQLSW